jgi:hypothetical protein
LKTSPKVIAGQAREPRALEEGVPSPYGTHFLGLQHNHKS